MPQWLTAFIASGAAVDWILAVVAFEALLLAVLGRGIQGRIPSASIVFLLLPGVFLLLALRCALTGAGAVDIALCLTLAFVAHVVDVVGRWRVRL